MFQRRDESDEKFCGGCLIGGVGCRVEKYEEDLLQTRWLLEVFNDGCEGDWCSLLDWIAVYTGANRGESDAGNFMLLGQIEAALVGTGQ